MLKYVKNATDAVLYIVFIARNFDRETHYVTESGAEQSDLALEGIPYARPMHFFYKYSGH